MRMLAIADFTFDGKEIHQGQIFDATEQQAQDLTNQDLAHRFHLEDPGHPPAPVAEPPVEPPPEEVLPDVPPVTIDPTEAALPAEGGSGIIAVTMTGPGTSGTWIATKDAAADWLSLMPDTPQSVDGEVDYAADINTDLAERTATITVNGAVFTLTQAAAVAADTASTHHSKRHSKG